MLYDHLKPIVGNTLDIKKKNGNQLCTSTMTEERENKTNEVSLRVIVVIVVIELLKLDLGTVQKTLWNGKGSIWLQVL